MSLRRIIAVTLTTGLVLVIVTAVIWTYLIATYESELGTSNVILVDSQNSVSDNRQDNSLVELNFDEDAEDLAWSSLEISLIIEETAYGCSFGSQSNSDLFADCNFYKIHQHFLTTLFLLPKALFHLLKQELRP